MSTERLEAILAQAQQLSAEELAQLIKQATQLLRQSQTTTPPPSYASLFGSGRGSFATREEADRLIRGERDSWAE